jgi:3-oxoacyl-[acyl-carrier-protein] synthase II
LIHTNVQAKIAGEVKNFDYRDHFNEETVKTAKRMDPFVHYANAALNEALEQSGLDVAKEAQRIGISLGSGIGGLYSQHSNSEALVTKGTRRVSPFYIPASIGNIASGFLSMVHGIKGPNLSVQTACATANHSMATAFMILQAGMADAMVAGGAEASIIELAVAGFANMRALSTHFNDQPEKASRPYDKDRDGFVMSEGASVLILEEYEHAKARGANILCEILSIGMSGDAYDLVIPEPEGNGAYASMKMAADYAGINTEEIDYINAHGTSTPLGDIAESKAIAKLLKGKEDDVWVGSTKSLHGHLLGATAGLEAIICALSIQNNLIPKNINIDNFDTDVAVRCINQEVVEKDVNIALSNSFGLGGHNSTVVLKKV